MKNVMKKRIAGPLACKFLVAFSIELPVQFRDIDCSGYVSSSTYLQWMESVRIEFMRELGENDICFRPRFIVASCKCEYRKPIVDERKVWISIWVSRIGKKSWDFDYLVRGTSGENFAKGRTTQVAYNYRKESKSAIPTDLRNILKTDFDSKSC